jgi:hypothetical protein
VWVGRLSRRFVPRQFDPRINFSHWLGYVCPLIRLLIWVGPYINLYYLLHTAAFPRLASTLLEIVQIVGDGSYFEALISTCLTLSTSFANLSHLQSLRFLNPSLSFILAFRIIVVSSCIFLAYNYHSECLENNLHTLTKSHVAEIQALEATYITSIVNLRNAFKQLERDHKLQRNDHTAVVSEHHKLKVLTDQYIMDENSGQQHSNNLFKTFPEFTKILLAPPH